MGDSKQSMPRQDAEDRAVESWNSWEPGQYYQQASVRACGCPGVDPYSNTAVGIMNLRAARELELGPPAVNQNLGEMYPLATCKNGK